MAKIVNLTGHDIVVLTEGEKITFPASGIARVETSQDEIGQVLNGLTTKGISLMKTFYGKVTGLPEPEPNTIFIVSSLVASRVPEREDVVAPDTGPTAIRENGQIVAVTRFQKP